MTVVFINYQGKRYAAYPGAGTRQHITSPQAEKDIKYIVERCGGRVIEWDSGNDVRDLHGWGVEMPW